MYYSRPSVTLVAMSLFLFTSINGWGHPGRQDANGGHVNRSTGEYHCHKPDCVVPGEQDDAVLEAEDPDDPVTIAESWGTAKKWARDTIYADHNTTFYCGCSYTPKSRSGGEVSHTACHYDDGDSEVKNKTRAVVMEWEHVVPASLMPARGFACWNGDGLPACSKGSRACCEKNDLNARVMIFDLHNMVPSVGQVNALRSNKRYGLVTGEERKLGACDFEWTTEIAEPPQVKQGEVARIWLYMAAQHGLELESGELARYIQWSNDDPPEEWEFTRNDRIKAKQGNGNPFVEMFPSP